MTGGLQLPQRLDTAGALRAATGIEETEALTHRLGHGTAVRKGLRRQQRLYRGYAVRMGQRPLDLMLALHAPKIASIDPLVQSLLVAHGQA